MVWSSGVTPAAVRWTRTRPSTNVGLGTSTSFRPPYPVNDSARIALMTPPLSPSPRYGLVEPDRGRKKCGASGNSVGHLWVEIEPTAVEIDRRLEVVAIAEPVGHLL